jgi:outer membrane immunogenic protein
MFSKMSAKHIALGLLAAAVATGFGESVARAQSAPPPPPIYVWSGSYLGLNAGVAQGLDATDESGSANSFGLGFGLATAGGGTMSAIGFTGGAVAGYNQQFGAYVVGVETDFSYLGVHGTQDAIASGFTNVSEHDSFQTNWLGTLRVRAGFAWDNWLFYTTGGGAAGDHNFNGVIRMWGVVNPSGSVTSVGWTAGLGMERMFAGGWTTTLEYLHADLGSETFTGQSGGSRASVTAHLTENVFRLGLNYMFGH